jgi:hypothetical protein
MKKKPHGTQRLWRRLLQRADTVAPAGVGLRIPPTQAATRGLGGAALLQGGKRVGAGGWLLVSLPSV